MESKKVEIGVNGRLLTGVITGTSVGRSHRASERGEKMFVLAEDGVEYQAWRVGAPPFLAERSALQPRRTIECGQV